MKKFLPTLSLVVLLSSSSAGAVFAMGSQSFSDVPPGSDYYDAVGYLKTAGIIDGYADGTFKPYQPINRAEFTKIIVGSTGFMPASNDSGGNDSLTADGLKFSDVHDGNWFNPYLIKAVQMGYISGYPDGTFKPAQNINFVEASKIIVVSYGGDFAGAGYAPEDWFHKYVNILEQKHDIPTTINTFDQQITRGEMAEMMYRLKTENVGKPSMTYDDLATPKGFLTGTLSYPAEGVPPEMIVCADSTANASTYCTYSKINSPVYETGVGYSLPVPAGTYNVYAKVYVPASSNFVTGLYSDYVTCGMKQACTSHKSINVKVTAGATVKGIDPSDWYQN